MGRRKPCCDKERVKKGTWSAEEDAILRAYAEKLPTVTNWISLPNKIGLNRCGKSCRLRWLNYLRPNIKHGKFSEEEDKIISDLYSTIGSRWSVIAEKLPGRTDNDIKNYWNTKLNKKFNEYTRKPPQSRGSFTGCSSIIQRQDDKNKNKKKGKKKDETVFTITHGDVMTTSWPSESQLFLQQPINGVELESNYCVINSESQDMLVRNSNGCTSQQQRGTSTSADVHVSPSLKELEDLLFDNNAPEMDAPDLASWDVELIAGDNSFNCERQFLHDFTYTNQDCVFHFMSQ